MRVFYGFEQLELLSRTVCTVGSYDGVHIGHRALIKECVELAHRVGSQSVVLTFEPHPRIVLGKADGLKLLTTLPEKIELLSQEGVDNLVVIPFDVAFSRLSYRDFIEDYLVNKLQMKYMVVGYNHLFGRNNEGNYTLLCDLAERHSFEVVQLSELRNDSSKVSSTVIRRLIESGDVEAANRLLGRDYLIIYDAADPLKLLPSAGRYSAHIDSIEAVVEFGANSVIASPSLHCGARVKIHKKL